MKKIVAVLCLVVLLSSCAWVCQHKSEIIMGLNAVVATATMLEALGVPAPVVELCQAAINLANQGLNQACPDVANLAAAQSTLAEAVGMAKAMGYRLDK